LRRPFPVFGCASPGRSPGFQASQTRVSMPAMEGRHDPGAVFAHVARGDYQLNDPSSSCNPAVQSVSKVVVSRDSTFGLRTRILHEVPERQCSFKRLMTIKSLGLPRYQIRNRVWLCHQARQPLLNSVTSWNVSFRAQVLRTHSVVRKIPCIIRRLPLACLKGVCKRVETHPCLRPQHQNIDPH
jgi:hypothetical protein